MQQHERAKRARDQRAADALEDIAVDILAARDLVWAGWLASQQLDGEDREALSTLLDFIAQKLGAAAEKTRSTRLQEGNADVA